LAHAGRVADGSWGGTGDRTRHGGRGGTMVLLLAELLASWFDPLLDPAAVARSITFRTAAATITAFLISVCFGGRFIRWLRTRYREPNVSPSPHVRELHAEKDGTPTMGGLLIIAATLIAAGLWGSWKEPLFLIGTGLLLGLGTLGVVDDTLKVHRPELGGLSERAKLLVQTALSLLVCAGLFLFAGGVGWHGELYVPVLGVTVSLGWFALPWVVFVLVGATNAVNLSDGLDGLAAGCYVLAGGAVAVLSYVAGHARLADHFGVPYVPGAGEVTVLMAGTIGAALGFLWYNCHPAEVFMGDTGALALGGMLAYAAIVARQEVLMALACGVFVVEAGSVLLQRACYKRTGRRLFKCAPIHHHFQLSGWPENRVVVRFWIVGAILATASLALLRLGAR